MIATGSGAAPVRRAGTVRPPTAAPSGRAGRAVTDRPRPTHRPAATPAAIGHRPMVRRHGPGPGRSPPAATGNNRRAGADPGTSPPAKAGLLPARAKPPKVAA